MTNRFRNMSNNMINRIIINLTINLEMKRKLRHINKAMVKKFLKIIKINMINKTKIKIIKI